MADVMEVYRALDNWAPFDTQMDFDNAGFLVGRGARAVSRVLVALDITEQVVEEAGGWGAQLIVSHHPVIFHPVKTITDASPLGRTLLRLAELGIAAICAHTNLDAVTGGVNDVLAQALGLTPHRLGLVGHHRARFNARARCVEQCDSRANQSARQEHTEFVVHVCLLEYAPPPRNDVVIVLAPL